MFTEPSDFRLLFYYLEMIESAVTFYSYVLFSIPFFCFHFPFPPSFSSSSSLCFFLLASQFSCSVTASAESIARAKCLATIHSFVVSMKTQLRHCTSLLLSQCSSCCCGFGGGCGPFSMPSPGGLFFSLSLSKIYTQHDICSALLTALLQKILNNFRPVSCCCCC